MWINAQCEEAKMAVGKILGTVASVYIYMYQHDIYNRTARGEQQRNVHVEKVLTARFVSK